MRIEQEWVVHLPFVHQVSCLVLRCRADAQHRSARFAYLLVMCCQLQQVRPAGRSPEVADHVDDGVSVDDVAEADLGPIDVGEAQVGEIDHGVTLGTRHQQLGTCGPGALRFRLASPMASW